MSRYVKYHSKICLPSSPNTGSPFVWQQQGSVIFIPVLHILQRSPDHLANLDNLSNSVSLQHLGQQRDALMWRFSLLRAWEMTKGVKRQERGMLRNGTWHGVVLFVIKETFCEWEKYYFEQVKWQNRMLNWQKKSHIECKEGGCSSFDTPLKYSSLLGKSYF